MTILDIMALCLQYGEKVHIVFGYKDENGKQKETDAYFGGFRYYEGEVIKDFLAFFPIFKEIDKNGNMSNRLLEGVKCWSPRSLQSISKLTNEKLYSKAVPALVKLTYNLKRRSYDAIYSIMKEYAKMHPGQPKVWIESDDRPLGMIEKKNSSKEGEIAAVSYVNGKLQYDIVTNSTYEIDVPNSKGDGTCGGYVYDEFLLLSTLLDAIKYPSAPSEDGGFPDADKFFNYIKPEARLRYNDDSEYRKAKQKPGPIVKVKELHPEMEGVLKYDTEVIIELDGKEITVLAEDLEPLAEGE